MDPLTKGYPWYTPYQFAGNTPIQAIDLDGKEEYHYTMTMGRDGEAVLKLAGKPKYYNEHSWFGGLISFKTEILSKRYEVDYEGKKYYIGYGQYGTGYSNSGKADEFENNYLKSKGDAIAFEYNYYDANHSQRDQMQLMLHTRKTILVKMQFHLSNIFHFRRLMQAI